MAVFVGAILRCSTYCGHRSRRKRETRICAYCGEPFEVKRTLVDICCSWKCRVERSKTPDWPTWTKELREGQECGDEFWVKPHRISEGGGEFCSLKCKYRFDTFENSTAPEFYSMALWKNIRVHHNVYKRNGGDEDPENLVTL